METNQRSNRDDRKQGFLEYDTEPTSALDDSRNTGEPELELARGTVVGDYVVERMIASGGFGIVYQGIHRTCKEPVAIKVLRSALAASPQAVARFEQEARAIHLIAHPNIVDILDIGQLADGRRYLVMELLEGPTLSALLAHKRRFTPLETLEFLEPIGAALSAAHTAQCVHRDIKASNIATTTIDGKRVVKLLDFGIAKLMECDPGKSVVTKAGHRIGTPSTMAPEQITGAALGPATDIYALGVLLFRLLTGQYPFYSPDPIEIERMHMGSPPPRPSYLAPVTPAVEAVVLRCLEKNPAARYPSVHSFLAALRDAAGLPHQSAKSSAHAYAIFVTVENPLGDGNDDCDDDLLDTMEELMDEIEQILEEGSFRIMVTTESTLLGVKLPSDSCHGPDDAWHQTVEFGHSLYQRAYDLVGDRFRLSIVVHSDQAVVQTSGAGIEMVGGEVLRVGAWLPEKTQEGVYITRDDA
ncbi:MAG: serine/threonine protein kinase [Proteobacteria bacterium]|nr:serine/threonine protein kinase [Pseudomonadota bacterium]